jgi:membrane-associated protease RseP (regulator of RpoE activity)
MNPAWLALIGILAFWAIAGVIIRRRGKWHGVSFEGGMLIWRTRFGLRFVDRAGKALRRFWAAFGTIGIVVGIIFMIYIFTVLLLNAAFVFQHPGMVPGVKLIYPGITIPLVEGLIALFSVLIVHEFSHGFLMRAQGLRTKSTGLLLWMVIPGAFVEQDEKQLKRAPLMKRLRVYVAGSFANVLFALLCLGLILALISPKPGVYAYGIEQGSPADNDNLWLGARIIEMDNVSIDSYEDYYDFVDNITLGENINILTENGIITITATENYRDNIGILPIAAASREKFLNPLFVAWAAAGELLGYPVIHHYVYDSAIPWEGITVLKWMFMLNLGIGLINLLPAVPLDGGYIFRGLLEKKVKKKTAKRVSYALALFILALIIINLSPMVWR